jgi:WD40 repeat protein
VLDSVSPRRAWTFIACLALLFARRGHGGAELLDGERPGRIRPVQLGSIPFGHSGPARAFAPDGNQIATVGAGNSIRLWNLATGTEQARFPACEDSIISLAYSPDGKLLASGGFKGDVFIWDVGKRKPLRSCVGHNKRALSSGVFAVVWIDSGEALTTASSDGNIRIWETATGKLLKSIQEPVDESKLVYWDSMAIHADSKVYASCSGTAVRVCDLMTGTVKERCGFHRDVHALAFSPDGRFLVTGSEDGRFRVWDRVQAKVCCSCGRHPDVRSIVFSRDGSKFVTASSNYELKIWRTRTGELLNIFRGPPGRETGLSDPLFSPSDTLLTAQGKEGIYIWDLKSGKLLPRKVVGHRGTVFSVAISPNGRLLASAEDDLLLWDLATRSVKHSLVGHAKTVRSVSFSPDGALLASASEDHTIRIWQTGSGKCSRVLRGHKGVCTSVTFSPDGTLLYTGSADKTIGIWNVTTGEKLNTIKGHLGEVFSVAISPNGKLLASSAQDNSIRLWDAPSGKAIATVRSPDLTVCLSFSPDSARIACGSTNVVILDATTGKVLSQGLKRKDWVRAVAFSPDGKTVAVSHDDECIRLWETATWKLRARLEGHEDRVWAVAFSPDGKYLVSGSGYPPLLLWDLGAERKR